jgi:hypothetical protein
MRILYVPCHEGGSSHHIPLLALHELSLDRSKEMAFLIPRLFHEFFRRNHIPFVDLDYDGSLHAEIEAAKKFRPDVVVDDWSLSTGFATTLLGLPRVTIQRISTFPGHVPANSNHQHSIAIDYNRYPDVTHLGLRQPRTLSDFFESAEMKIIPGIRSVEVLPEALQNDPTYVYCGPLLGDDYFIEADDTARSNADVNQLKDFSKLQSFFDSNRGRKTVYFTFGNVAKANGAIQDCIRHLLGNQIAVVTNIPAGELDPEQQQLYLRASYLPMHFMCSNVNLVIHPGSTGAYHYPILHNVQSITIGTQRIDREDASIRLQELGASVHIPAAEECEDFFQTFKTTVAECLDENSPLVEARKKAVTSLNAEIEETVSRFDYDEVLNRAIHLSKSRRRP